MLAWCSTSCSLCLRHCGPPAADAVAVALTREGVERATERRARDGVKTPDALHPAAAVASGYDESLTDDHRPANVPGIAVEVVSPAPPSGGSLSGPQGSTWATPRANRGVYHYPERASRASAASAVRESRVIRSRRGRPPSKRSVAGSSPARGTPFPLVGCDAGDARDARNAPSG